MPQPYDKVRLGRKSIFINNFIGGIGWSLGATIGVSLIIAVITLVLKQISLTPYIGNFIIQVAKFVTEHSQGYSH